MIIKWNILLYLSLQNKLHEQLQLKVSNIMKFLILLLRSEKFFQVWITHLKISFQFFWRHIFQKWYVVNISSSSAITLYLKEHKRSKKQPFWATHLEHYNTLFEFCIISFARFHLYYFVLCCKLFFSNFQMIRVVQKLSVTVKHVQR